MTSTRAILPGALLALALPAASQSPADWQPVLTFDGRVAIAFHEESLEQAGLELIEVAETAEVGDAFEEFMEGDLYGFHATAGTDLMALQTGGEGEERFVPYGILGGDVVVDGGFVLASPGTGRYVDFTNFRIYPKAVHNDGPGGAPDPDYFYLTTADEPHGTDFNLCYVKISITPDPGYEPFGDHDEPPKLRIKAWDLVVTESLADKLGRPDLAGRFLGHGKMDLDIEDWEGDWDLPPGQNPFTPYGGPGGGDGFAAGGTFLDVKLGILNSITQLGHVGIFPGGRTGMSMATTSCNVGDVNVTWLAAMNEDHPGIAMQLYRQMSPDGAPYDRFEMVGVSWIKHGFFALSNSQCTPCQNPSPGTFLGVGCSDTYGTSNNGDRFWLGPRDEWDASTAEWTCLGSFFDGTPVDCDRDENGAGFGPVDHRLESFDSDLGLPGATYSYEANYLVREDDDLMNNIGSRRCTMSWNGFSWNFTTPGSNPLVEGPALLMRWGDKRTVAGIGDGGDVVLSASATDLGDGTWRYEYALFNWTLDRKVRAFSVPFDGVVSDFFFHDIDDEPSNDWAVTTGGKNVTWTFPDVFLDGHKIAGPLEFSTLYNFGFTSNVGPGDRNAALTIHEDGPGGDYLAVDTLAPQVLALTANTLSPAPGEDLDLILQGATVSGLYAVTEVDGVPLVPPVILNPGNPAPSVGGEAILTVRGITSALSGVAFEILAADFDTSVIKLSNTTTVKVQ